MLTYDVLNQEFIINRDHSGKGPGGIRKAPISLKNNMLALRIFIDRSSVEIFLQEGEKVMSARIYPNENSTGVQLFTDHKTII
ncbi:GH32 C-terminal domain-containing protein [Pseudalkalibacillus hwajinpoensis]|uniref:GH32 C-terminal domain-containing protein n=1 Tax=Guptibacillus hwajinpoensis TaxID=208199 RepID=UPI00325AFA7E